MTIASLKLSGSRALHFKYTSRVQGMTIICSIKTFHQKKTKSTAKILADCAPHLITLVTLSIKNRREKYLKHILNCYQKLHRKKLGIVRTQVEIARELSNETLLSIKHFIANSLKKEIELDVMVDPSLIGGFKLTIDDRLMDKSIRGELELLRKQFN